MPKGARWEVRADDKASQNLQRVRRSFQNLASSAAVLEGPLGGVSGRISAIGAAASRLGPAMLGLGVSLAGFTFVAGKAVAAGTAFERVMLRLEGVQRATGNASGFTARQLNEMAEQLDRSTLASLQGAREGVALLSTFTNITGERFRETLKLGQDMASVFGGDLRSNLQRLARVINDPTTNLSALNRVGITFTETQKKLVKELQESGRLFEAQGVIIDALKGKIGGTGEAEARGLSGAVDTLSHRWTTLLETIGKTERLNLVAGAVNLLSDALSGFRRLLDDPTGPQQLSALVEARTSVLAKLADVRERFGNSPLGGAQSVIAGLEADLKRLNAEIGKVTRGRALQAKEERDVAVAAKAGLAEREAEAKAGRDQEAADKAAEKAAQAAARAREAAARAAAAHQKQIQALVEGLRTERDTYSMTTLQARLYTLEKMKATPATLAEAAALAKEIEALDAAKAAREAHKVQLEALAAAQKAQETAARDALEALEEQVDVLGMTARQAALYRLHLKGLTAEQLASADAMLKTIEANKKLTEGTTGAQDAARDLGLTFSSAFEDAIVGGKGLRDLLRGLEQDILRIVTRHAVTEPLGAAIAGIFDPKPAATTTGTPAAAGGFWQSLIGFFGGAEHGGTVMANRPKVVGERGPELFLPMGAGRVAPMGAGGGGINVTVNVGGGAGAAMFGGGGGNTRAQVAASVGREIARSVRRHL